MNWNKSGKLEKGDYHYLLHIHSGKGKVVFRSIWSSCVQNKVWFVWLLSLLLTFTELQIFNSRKCNILSNKHLSLACFDRGSKFILLMEPFCVKSKTLFELHIQSQFVNRVLFVNEIFNTMSCCLCACSEIRKNILFRPVYSSLRTLNPNCVVFVCFYLLLNLHFSLSHFH